jgi:Cu(I)/Ag(I) efflux system membrane fusion protein
VYEYQLPYVREGQAATMSLPYIPGQTWEGKVIYVYPFLSEGTRQAKVRLEFDNANGQLKQGMFANITLTSTLAEERVLAPQAAIIDTGKRKMAFVSLGEGKFEPREVQTGIETEGAMVEVRDGLRPGERVVTSGQFLIDSEARIREGLARMVRGEQASDQKAAVAQAQGAEPSMALPEPVKTALSELLKAYLAIGDALAADKTEGVADRARAVAAAVDAMLKTPLPGQEHFWHQHDEVATVRGKALELVEATDLKDARLRYADLSVALSKFLSATGVPQGFEGEVQQLHCPMYLEGQGGSTWLQLAGDVRNPYFGSVMLQCFDKRSALPTGQ